MGTSEKRSFKVWLRATFRELFQELLEEYFEQWLTADKLCEQYGCFTKDWLKHYAESSGIPRTRIEGKDSDGNIIYRSRWCYPRYKINRMLLDGSIKNLVIND